VYEELRPLLFSIAYRMVGSVGEAEDIIQEAFLRFHDASRTEDIESPKAWLLTVTTRLSINHLRSARVRRESYIGTWLPEPLVTDAASDPAEQAETADSLSTAFLVLLESLTPVERAVFLLRDVFDYGYDEIAVVVGKGESNCRQLATRARRQVHSGKRRFEATQQRHDDLARRFFGAIGAGDTEGLISLLAEDVVAYGDGGGKARAISKPIHGRESVQRLLSGFRARPEPVAGMRLAHINGRLGAVFHDAEGRPVVVISLDIAHDLVHGVYGVSNPDKLRHLGALSSPPSS
jgi:RNA polymerase sigma-70 factor (ECF subfamily)